MKSQRFLIRLLWLGCALLLITVAAMAQRGRRGGFRGGGFGFGDRPQAQNDVTFPEDGGFHFLRMEYTDSAQYRGGFRRVSRRGAANGWWAQDYPDAENHFSFGLQRLTLVNVGEPVHYALTDDEIFEYPWLYVTQSGNWELSDEEIMRMREYVDRGGFIMNDDTWGAYEQQNFEDAVKRAFPEWPIVDMGEDDPMMNVMYNIHDQDRTYIPGTRHLYGGRVSLPAGSQPRWLAIHDNKDRAVVAINYDTDIGDAWEYADDPSYPEAMTTLAYHYGINYLIYAMTH